MKRRPLSTGCLLAIAMLFLGTLLRRQAPPSYALWEGEELDLTGRVYQKEAYYRNEERYWRLYLEDIRPVQKEEAGSDSSLDKGKDGSLFWQFFERQNGKQRILCYLKDPETAPAIGSRIRAKGIIRDFTTAVNPGQFDARAYYQTERIAFQLNQTAVLAESPQYNRLKEGFCRLRIRLADTLEATLPKSRAAVMKTMLLGMKNEDAELKGLYQRNGIAHIMAISGLHISLIGTGLYRLLQKTGLPGWLAAIPALFFIGGYGMLTGFSVSAARAVLMFSLSMGAVITGRTYDRITALALAGTLLLLYQPLYFYSSSFLFSFGCILAIQFLIPALLPRNDSDMLGRRVAVKEKMYLQALAEKILPGWIITLASLPIQLSFYYQMPLYAAVLNLLVIPLMSFLIPAGILLILLYRIFPLRWMLAVLINGILAVYEGMCYLADKLPFHLWISGRPAGWKILLFIGILGGIAAGRKKLSFWLKWGMLLGGALILLRPAREQMTVTFLDVGQGDCIHIQTPGGRNYLIDGGSSTVSKTGRYRILPYLKYRGISRIDQIFITHPDKDHVSGILELLEMSGREGIQIRGVCLPDIEESARSDEYRALLKEIEESAVPCDYLSLNEGLWEDNRLLLRCLHPPMGYGSMEENENSMVLLLEYGSFRALFTGDITGEGEKLLLEQLQKQSVEDIALLKVAHHGSLYSTPVQLLEQLRPKVAVISVGRENRYGHPGLQTLERLQQSGCRIYRTDESGAITVRVRSGAIAVERFVE